MPDEPKAMTCWEFKVRFLEILRSGERIQEHPHYKACKRCRDLSRIYLHEMMRGTRNLKSRMDDWREST